MAMDKRTWVNIAAGTVAIIAIIFGVKQCSDKQDAREEAQEWHSIVNRNNETLTDASNALTDANNRIKDLTDSLAAGKNEIATRDSTIANLRDSLTTCLDSKACPCKPKTKAPCKCKKKTKTVKVAQKPCKPAPQKPCKTTTDVEVTSGENKFVVSGACTRPDQAVIVNGDNNGVVIVNSNGIVNANDNINGINNTVNSIVMDGANKQRCGTTARIVLGRSKCR